MEQAAIFHTQLEAAMEATGPAETAAPTAPFPTEETVRAVTRKAKEVFPHRKAQRTTLSPSQTTFRTSEPVEQQLVGTTGHEAAIELDAEEGPDLAQQLEKHFH